MKLIAESTLKHESCDCFDIRRRWAIRDQRRYALANRGVRTLDDMPGPQGPVVLEALCAVVGSTWGQELMVSAGLEVERPDRTPLVGQNHALSEPGWFAAGNVLGGLLSLGLILDQVWSVGYEAQGNGAAGHMLAQLQRFGALNHAHRPVFDPEPIN